MPTQTPPAPTHESNEDTESVVGLVRDALRLLARRKLVAIGVACACVAAGWGWLEKQSPIYEATATVMVDVSSPRTLTNVREVVELGSPQSYFGGEKYFRTQYEVVKSRAVASRVLDTLDLWGSEHLLGLDAPGVDMTEEERLEALAAAHMPTVLAKRILVESVKDSMLLKVSFRDRDGRFATEIANAVAEAYEKQNLEQKRSVVASATGDLQRMLDDAEEKFAVSEGDMRGFETTNEIGSIPTSRRTVDDRLSVLNSKLTSARSKRIGLQARATSLKPYLKARDVFKVASTRILEDPVVRLLKQELVQIEAKRDGLLGRYLEQHPEVVAVERQLESLKSAARREVRNLAQAVQRELKEIRDVEVRLEAAVEAAEVQSRTLADVERGYGRLVETRDQRKSVQDDLRARLVETTMSAKVGANNIRVMERATVPTLPVWPRRNLVLAAALLAGLLLGALAALLLELADATIKSAPELEELSGLRVVGVLPLVGQKKNGGRGTPGERQVRDRYIIDNPNSQMAEAARTLRANLQFLGRVRDMHTLVVTSADPEEGKSTVAVSIASSMAQSGRTVLLLEADLRRPRLQTTFEDEIEGGLSACILDDAGVSLSEHVVETDVPGLHFMPAGPVPPNPGELLQLPRFTEILEMGKAEYDLVIVDSPPVLAVADPLVLAGHVDAAIVVAAAGRTTRHALREALRRLRAIHAPLLGMVFNYHVEGRHRYGYGYGYGHGYGYGYGQDAESVPVPPQ